MNEKKIIPALTGIRAVCVYFIYLSHQDDFLAAAHPHLWLIANQFYCFLDFFLVLSGFLIYYKYSEIGGLNKITLYNYFVNRMARVYPTLLILISATFFTGYYHHYYSGHEAIKVYLLNITLLKGFSAKYWLSGIGPTWSMTVEELFYLLSPLIFLFAKNVGGLIKTVLIIYGMGILLTLLFHFYPYQEFFGDLFFTAYSTFFGRAFEFVCGIFLGMVVKGVIKNRLITYNGKSSLYLGLFIIVASIVALYYIALSNYPGVTLSNTTLDVGDNKRLAFYHSWLGMGINNIVFPIGVALLFYSLIYYESFLQRFLSSKLMVQLGASTYSFYILHTSFALSYINKFISTNIFVSFICMIIVSYIFYKLVEQPLTLFVRKIFYKKQYTIT